MGEVVARILIVSGSLITLLHTIRLSGVELL